MSLTSEAEGAMTDPKDLQHYFEERIGEKNKAAQQARQSAELGQAEFRENQSRRHAITLLTDTIIPFLEESKKAMTGARLIVNPKVTNHEVAGVTFQIRDREEKAVQSSVYDIDIGTEIPLVRSRREADEQSAGVDLADRVGMRKFQDLYTKPVAQLLKIAIDEYVMARAQHTERMRRIGPRWHARQLRSAADPRMWRPKLRLRPCAIVLASMADVATASTVILRRASRLPLFLP